MRNLLKKLLLFVFTLLTFGLFTKKRDFNQNDPLFAHLAWGENRFPRFSAEPNPYYPSRRRGKLKKSHLDFG